MAAKIVTDLIRLVFQTKSFIWPAENLFENKLFNYILELLIDIDKISKTTKNIILRETASCFMLTYFVTKDYQLSDPFSISINYINESKIVCNVVPKAIFKSSVRI